MLCFGAVTTGGCYSVRPLVAAPVAGSEVVLDINDQGRVALGETLGGSVSRVTGKVRSRTDSAYVLSVTGVDYLNGADTKWSGEALTIRSSLVSQAQARSFSRRRTTLAAIIAGGLVAAFIVTRSIFGNGSPPMQGSEGGGGATQ